MKISEIYKKKKPVISFEIFPPKKSGTINSIFHTIDQLADLQPDFISVTYGAGGTTTKNTIEIASIIKNNSHIESLAHLTCVSATKSQINDIALKLESNQIENILALRGDFPKDPNFKFPTPLHYHHASDLVEDLKTRFNFCLGGAFYPEGHVESHSMEEDLKYVKLKVDNGMDFLISQMFFDNQYFFDYSKNFNGIGCNVPLSAGIMPVTNGKQIVRISELSGASIPKKLSKIISHNVDNPEQMKKAGISYATEQIQDLIERGVDGIHIYTMNKPEIARSIIEHLDY